MSKVKDLTRCNPQNWKKDRNFYQAFFCNLVSRFTLIWIKILFSIECKWFYGAKTVFSPQPLKKLISLDFFVKVSPQEESKCKNTQLLQWILKDHDVYFKKNHSISKLREFFRSEKYRVFTQHVVVAIWRHLATMG